MYVKVDNPKSYSGGNNKGSSYNLLSYLEKENKGLKEEDKQRFFTQERDNLYKNEVINLLDKNHKNLGHNDSKFYSLHIDPSTYEQKHILKHIGISRKINSVNELSIHEKKAYENELREYTRGVMGLYAANFNRGLTGNDLVYGAKIEHTRKHSYNSKEVKHNKSIDKLEKELKTADILRKQNIKKEISKLGGYERNSEGKIIREGVKKDGMNSHIHIAVSRNNAAQNSKISPLAKPRLNEKHKVGGRETTIGFNHEAWKEVSAEYFNEKYNYKSKDNETYNAPSYKKQSRSEAAKFIDTKTRKTLNQAKHHILKGSLKNEEKILKATIQPHKELKKALMKKTSVFNIKQHLSSIVLGNILER